MMTVLVSDLRKYIFCPRSVFLHKIKKAKPKITSEKSRDIFFQSLKKEISFSLADLVESSGGTLVLEDLLGLAESANKRMPFIYPEIFEEPDFCMHASDVLSLMRPTLSDLSEWLNAMLSEVGFQKTIDYLKPHRQDYILFSKKLQLSGRIDKLFKLPFYSPVIVKAGNVPCSVWPSERIVSCALVLLLEERFGSSCVGCGFVEYFDAFERRPVLVTRELRRKTLDICDNVLSLFESGCLPPKVQNPAKCRACGFKGLCDDI